MSLSGGVRLGPYEITGLLGAGGMGEVHRARDTRLDRDVAVKVLPVRLAEDAVALARFEREAKAVAALSHPNILGIFDVGREGSTAYVVTELLEGETLRERLAAGALPARKAAEYAAQIARGLAAAHEKDIVHRDLKPENVFVTGDGRVKILDFGLAKQEQSPEDLSPTKTPTRMATTDPGVVLGTVAYMAPEQVRGRPVDHRADLFAFGATLYEMLAGRRAFQRETAAETMTAILREDPPDLAALDPKIPPNLVRIVQHCLEKRPEERFQSARDLAFDLEAIASGSTTGTQPAAVPGRRRRRWVAATAVALVGVCCVAGAFLAGRLFANRAAAPLPTFRQLTFQPQKITGAAFAPDGETVVFSAARETSVPDLFLLRPEYPEPTATGLRRTHVLAVSSKGELAVFTNVEATAWRNVFGGTLARVPLGGTGPRALLDGVGSADWSPDGTELAVIMTGSKDRLEYPIGKVLYESSGALGWLRVSPRGDRVALTEHPSHFDDRGFVIMVDRSGKRTVLAGEYGSLEGLAWSPAGDEVLFTGGRSYGNYTVYGANLKGRVRVAARSAGGLTLLDVSRTGRWLVTRDDRAIAIRGRGPGNQAEMDLSFLDGSWSPVLSSDGRTMVFTEVSAPIGANYTFYMRGTDGSPVVRLGEGMATAISPDGKWALAVTQDPQQVVMCPIGSGEKRMFERGSLVGIRFASFFPDGKRILVCGNEEGRAARCYEQGIAGGPPRAVTPGGEIGLVSPDCRRAVVWDATSAPSLCQLGGGLEAIPTASSMDTPIRWSPDGQSLLVLRRSGGQALGAIERVDLRSGKREVVREIAPPERPGELFLASASITADYKAYAYAFFRMRSILFLVDGVR